MNPKDMTNEALIVGLSDAMRDILVEALKAPLGDMYSVRVLAESDIISRTDKESEASHE